MDTPNKLFHTIYSVASLPSTVYIWWQISNFSKFSPGCISFSWLSLANRSDRCQKIGPNKKDLCWEGQFKEATPYPTEFTSKRNEIMYTVPDFFSRILKHSLRYLVNQKLDNWQYFGTLMNLNSLLFKFCWL